MQVITYEHWLPLIIGEEGMKQLGQYRGYDANEDPTISNVFAASAFRYLSLHCNKNVNQGTYSPFFFGHRFGHTLINPVLKRLNSSFEPIPEGGNGKIMVKVNFR